MMSITTVYLINVTYWLYWWQSGWPKCHFPILRKFCARKPSYSSLRVRVAVCQSLDLIYLHCAVSKTTHGTLYNSWAQSCMSQRMTYREHDTIRNYILSKLFAALCKETSQTIYNSGRLNRTLALCTPSESTTAWFWLQLANGTENSWKPREIYRKLGMETARSGMERFVAVETSNSHDLKTCMYCAWFALEGWTLVII